MEKKIVLGSLFGDEGKGVTVQWLCKKALDEGKKPIVIRFSGGPQAGHTICNGDITHICSTYGSGVLLGVPTVLIGGAYYDPISAAKEYAVLKRKMDKVPPLYVTNEVKIITPYDVVAGQKNTKVLTDGTCGKGIYPTFKRYECIGNRISPLPSAHRYYMIEPNQEWDKAFSYYYSNGPAIYETPYFTDYDVLIFEGSQGLLLDMERGFYPNVTPSKVGLNGIPEGFLYNAEVYLVMRSYLTRHGNGYKPSGLTWDLSEKWESNVTNKFQGDFKIGKLETNLIKRATERHCLDVYKNLYNCQFNLVMTHMDVHPETENSLQRAINSFPDGLISRVFTNDSKYSNIKEYGSV